MGVGQALGSQRCDAGTGLYQLNCTLPDATATPVGGDAGGGGDIVYGVGQALGSHRCDAGTGLYQLNCMLPEKWSGNLTGSQL